MNLLTYSNVGKVVGSVDLIPPPSGIKWLLPYTYLWSESRYEQFWDGALLSIGKMCRNGIQRHVLPDNPYSFIVFTVYFAVIYLS